MQSILTQTAYVMPSPSHAMHMVSNWLCSSLTFRKGRESKTRQLLHKCCHQVKWEVSVYIFRQGHVTDKWGHVTDTCRNRHGYTREWCLHVGMGVATIMSGCGLRRREEGVQKHYEACTVLDVEDRCREQLVQLGKEGGVVPVII